MISIRKNYYSSIFVYYNYSNTAELQASGLKDNLNGKDREKSGKSK